MTEDPGDSRQTEVWAFAVAILVPALALFAACLWSGNLLDTVPPAFLGIAWGYAGALELRATKSSGPFWRWWFAQASRLAWVAWSMGACAIGWWLDGSLSLPVLLSAIIGWVLGQLLLLGRDRPRSFSIPHQIVQWAWMAAASVSIIGALSRADWAAAFTELIVSGASAAAAVGGALVLWGVSALLRRPSLRFSFHILALASIGVMQLSVVNGFVTVACVGFAFTFRKRHVPGVSRRTGIALLLGFLAVTAAHTLTSIAYHHCQMVGSLLVGSSAVAGLFIGLGMWVVHHAGEATQTPELRIVEPTFERGRHDREPNSADPSP